MEIWIAILVACLLGAVFGVLSGLKSRASRWPRAEKAKQREPEEPEDQELPLYLSNADLRVLNCVLREAPVPLIARRKVLVKIQIHYSQQNKKYKSKASK